jgi:hypothetical protein
VAVRVRLARLRRGVVHLLPDALAGIDLRTRLLPDQLTLP